MRRFLQRLLPRTDSHLFFHRELTDLPPRFNIPGVELKWIASAARPDAAMLEAFAVAQGFPPGWSTELLAEQAIAGLAAGAETGQPIAMAWLTMHPFHVEEIGATFDPRGAAYLFGDFVAPAFRGRKLQRLLVSHRLHHAKETCISAAYTIIHPTNAASINSYTQEGFAEEGKVTTTHWLGKTSIAYTSSASPARIKRAQPQLLTTDY